MRPLVTTARCRRSNRLTGVPHGGGHIMTNQIIENEYDIEEVRLTPKQVEQLATDGKVSVRDGRHAVTVSTISDESPTFEGMNDLLAWMAKHDYMGDWDRDNARGDPEDGDWIEFWSVHPQAVDTFTDHVTRLTPFTEYAVEPSPGANTNDTGKFDITFEKPDAANDAADGANDAAECEHCGGDPTRVMLSGDQFDIECEDCGSELHPDGSRR